MIFRKKRSVNCKQVPILFIRLSEKLSEKLKLNASLLLGLFIRSSCPLRKGNDPVDPLMFRP